MAEELKLVDNQYTNGSAEIHKLDDRDCEKKEKYYVIIPAARHDGALQRWSVQLRLRVPMQKALP